MKSTKLIQLLKTFLPSEFSEFGRFVNSPFHNQSRKMISLYDVLKKHYPAFEGKNFTKVIIYSHIYPAEKFNDKKFRERFSDMLGLAEDYLAIIHIKKDSVKYKMQTLNEFSKRDLAVHFDKKHREITALLDKEIFKDENLFYEEYILHSRRIEFYQNIKLVGKRKPFFDEISEHIELFLRYFTAQMLKNYAVINNIKHTMKYDYEHKFYRQVMKYTDENYLERFPLIKALRLIIKINEDRKDVSSYFALKELYLKYHASMNMYDKTMIITELQIQSRLWLRTGNTDLSSESFEIMKLQIEHDTYTRDKGWMKREFFLVCVDTALSQGSIEWARKFIKEYSPRLGPKLRDDVNLWAAGTLYLHEKKYEAALKEFSKIKTGDFVYYFWVKVPVSRIHYELKDHDNVLLLIDSYKHYIKANKLIPEYIKVWYGTYFNLLYKLTMLAISYDDYRASMLAEEIKTSGISVNVSKSWLLDKVTELKKNNS